MSEIDKQLELARAALAASLAKCEELLEAGKALAERVLYFDNYLKEPADHWSVSAQPQTGSIRDVIPREQLLGQLAHLADKARALLKLYERKQ